ncbi:VirD4-like conjugal transfer protein, CD1115 family [Bulleidia sp. zg-1006]|uniref:VirD4-like conjugal transfer protein, CD1115 family n=1 Tax=Bulleidia sp. zg-1006 TaxID=2806552 RepID=UPI0019399AF2|nr:type IV secretory system conjugative DNA transfer family protein [Bulleidia sp. zg-1006]QRG86063.1 type IV secretory system conjugative DNA transfer family protein [Bulleidia sp. zg-1006]
MKDYFKNNPVNPILILIFGLLFILGNRYGLLILEELNRGTFLLFSIINATLQLLPSILTRIEVSFHPLAIILGTSFVALAWLGLAIIEMNRKNYRPKEEHGSARYGRIEKEGSPLKNEEDEKYNVIYSQNIQVSMDTRKTFLNNNTLTIGGSGSGKTRFHVKPNILNLACNYIITDPKDTLCKEVGNVFYKAGYDMKYLNLIEFSKSMHYNPFNYIYSAEDILKFVNNLISSTNKEVQTSGGDGFFEKAEIALLTACIFLIFATTSEDDPLRNMNELMDLIDMASASEEDENQQSQLDLIFNHVEEYVKNQLKLRKLSKISYEFLALRQYNIYKKAAGKTAKSILISIGVRMAVFNLPQLAELLKYDELNLESIGNPHIQPKYDDNHQQCQDSDGHLVYLDVNGEDCICEDGKYINCSNHEETAPALQKTVLFVSISDSDSSFNFLATMIYQQLFDLLYRQADARVGGTLPIHTRFCLDEFANISKINDFEKKIATMRSREISVDCILQNLAQLKNLYKETWETIEGNCDVTLFLGGKEYSTLERLSKIIGNTTVDHLSINESYSSSGGSYSKSNQIVSRALLSPDEIGRLPTDECLIHIRGQHIFRDKKFDLFQHENIVDTADFDKKNEFDTSKFKEFAEKKGIMELIEEIDQLFDGQGYVNTKMNAISNLEVQL